MRQSFHNSDVQGITCYTESATLCFLCLRGQIGEYIVLVNHNNHATCYFHLNGVGGQIDTLHCSIYTSAGDNLSTLGQRILKLAYLFCFFCWGRIMKSHIITKIAIIIINMPMPPP